MPWRPGVVLLVLVCYCYAGSDEHKPNLRIFNGDDAAEGEYPFVGLLLATSTFSSDGSIGGQNMCGGSILSDRIILTAAHCVVKDTAITDEEGSAVDELYYPRNLEFHVGETHLYETEASEQIMQVAAIMVHEEYDSFSVVNDVALLVLDKPITLNEKVATIALPDPEDRATLYADGAAITVIGWGTTEDGTTSDKLKKLPYTISSKADCKTNYGEGLLDGMMCTGTAPTEKRADTGDSGGPLFTKKEGEWVQLGLVSWGPTEITDSSFDVNTDVLYFRDWIVAHKDSAFTDYVTSLTATSSAKMVILENLANYLYKTIKITPATSTKHTKITIKSGTMKPYDFLIVYDGDDPLQNTMLAQLSGTLSEQSFTSSTVKGLTVAILTGKEGKSDGFILEYSEVSDAATNTQLICSTGYTACADKFYCLNNKLFCDSNQEGNCRDKSDEVKANCDNINDNNTDDNNTDNNNTDDNNTDDSNTDDNNTDNSNTDDNNTNDGGDSGDSDNADDVEDDKSGDIRIYPVSLCLSLVLLFVL